MLTFNLVYIVTNTCISHILQHGITIRYLYVLGLTVSLRPTRSQIGLQQLYWLYLKLTTTQRSRW